MKAWVPCLHPVQAVCEMWGVPEVEVHCSLLEAFGHVLQLFASHASSGPFPEGAPFSCATSFCDYLLRAGFGVHSFQIDELMAQLEGAVMGPNLGEGC